MAKRSKKKGGSKRGEGGEKNAASGAGGSGGGDPTLPAAGSTEGGGNNGGATTADLASGEVTRSLGDAGENTDAALLVASACDSKVSGGGAVPCGASSVAVESVIPFPGLVAGSEDVAVAVVQDRDGSPPAAALAGDSEAATATADVSQQDLDSSMVDEMDAWIADEHDSSALRAERSGPLDPPEGEEDGAVAHGGGGRMAPGARDGPGVVDSTPPSSPTASAALADGNEDGGGEAPNPTTAVLPEEARVVGVAASSGEGVETPPRVAVLPAMETSREMAGEARERQQKETVERPETARSATQAPPPPFDTGPEHDPSAMEEVRSGAAADGVPTEGETARAVPLTTTLVVEAGLGGNAEENAALAAVGKPVSGGITPAVERIDKAATETLAATPTPASAAAVPPAAAAALAAAAAAASVSAASPMPPESPSEPFGVAAKDDSAALRAAEPGSPEGSSEPPPAVASLSNEEATFTLPASPTTSADINDNNTAACPEQGVEVLARDVALAAVAEEAASLTPSPPPSPPLNSATGGGGPGRDRATAAKAAAASARAAALLASAQAASAAEVAAAAVAEAEAALGAVAGPKAKGGAETNAGESAAPRLEAGSADDDLVMTKANQAGADKVGMRTVFGGDAVSTVGPAPGSVEPPAMPDSVVAAAATPVEVVDEPSEIQAGVVSPIAGAAAAAATAAASERSSHDVAAQALGEGGEGGASATRAAVDGADADPPVAAPLPPVFSDGSGGSESDAAAAVAAVEPTGATILSGSVTAEVFASRSGTGAIPWPDSSEDDESNHGDEYDGGDKNGRRSSSRNHMSVEEAAAFMNPGGAGTGRMGSGRFASGSSWGGASAIGHLDRILGLPTAVPPESSPGATAAADGGGAPGGGFSSSSGWLLLGGGAPPLGEPFVGPDDFLSPSSVGMSGLAARRFSFSAAVMQGFASSGGVAEDAVGGLGVRRSTVNEIRSSRGAELCSDEAEASQAAGVGIKEVVVAEGDGASDDDDSIDAGEEGGVRPTERAAEEKPAPAATQVQEETPTLLLRRGEEGQGGKAAAVQAVSTVVAGQEGTSNRSGGSGLRDSSGEAVIAGEGVGGVKNSDGNEGLDASESAATSFAGAEGEAGWPPGGVEGRSAVSGTRAAAGGGCCVMS
ncbi:unnamed protein product [Ectocarpus sp. CCAP 1310/34]|nr:unnamed protein product [Ectocarpus sp. CCAP 1310/34]